MEEKGKNNVSTMIFFLLPVTVLLVINAYFLIGINMPGDEKIISIYFFLGIVIMFIFAVLSIHNLSKKMENETAALRNHLQQSEEILHNGAAQRHEYVRHLQSLQALIDMERFDQAMEYINSITHLQNSKDQVYDVGHVAINWLVNAKHAIAKEQAMDFQVHICAPWHDVNMPFWHLNSLVGNLLDNAFEAAAFDRHPRVVVSFDRTEEYHVVSVANNGSKVKDPQAILQAGVSSKGAKDHGYGLGIVRQIVAEHHGQLRIETEPFTRFTVKLPVKKEDENVW